MATRILLANEPQMIRQGYRSRLDKEPDFEVVEEVDNGEAMLRLSKETRPDVVILDLAMAGLNGLHSVHQIAAAAPRAKVIGLSRYGDGRFVVDFLKTGA
jgi:DNA-binding NarL/FixJ family response regulator